VHKKFAPATKARDPTDWFVPEVLVPDPDYYPNENSGPSSEESSEDEDDLSRAFAPKSPTPKSPRSPIRPVSSQLGSSFAHHDEETDNEDEGEEEDDDEDDEEDDGESVDFTQNSGDNERASDDEDDISSIELGDGEDADEEFDESDYDSDDGDDWEDKFPYESNLFSLAEQFKFEKRIATADDAIVYRGTDRATGEQLIALVVASANVHFTLFLARFVLKGGRWPLRCATNTTAEASIQKSSEFLPCSKKATHACQR